MLTQTSHTQPSGEQPPAVLIQRRPDSGAGGIEAELASLLAARGFRVLITPELYSLPEDDPTFDSLRQLGGLIAVFGWLHPRPMGSLLEHHRIGTEGLTVQSMSDPVKARAAAEALPGPSEPLQTQETTPVHWDAAPAERWYPLIDPSRCIGCQHCLQFCLFGVYELDDDGRVRVVRPDNCKSGCPACARVCPQSAIMFPLYRDHPGIAGAPGEYVRLDAAARRMFYTRTGKPCPVCGRADRTAAAGGTPSCAECGRPLAGAPHPPDQPSPDADAISEIDALIDELDRL